MEKKPLEAILLDIDLESSWDDHIDAVRPQIAELDRLQMKAIAKAPFIVVTNSSK